METKHTVVIGDSRDMNEVPGESVHLVVTSPPYWQLKDYGEAGQIGYNDSYEEYINNLNLVWNECYRVLHKGCRLCINIGDQFARSAYYGRYKVIPIRAEIIRFCETIGFDYMGAIIWQKVTTTNTTGGASIMGSYPYPRNGILKLDYEFILIFKKLGRQPQVSREIKERSKLSKEEWNTWFSGHWNFPGVKQTEHLAMFPEELPKRLIRMFSMVGDTVLDPFLGSGTTCLAAVNNERNSIGYEKNPDFTDEIKDKLGFRDRRKSSGRNIEITSSNQISENFQDRIEALPYIFHDPVRFQKRSKPVENNFGSKIRNDDQNLREKYHRVKAVNRPDLIQLDNDEFVRLIGIKPVKEKQESAIKCLSEYFSGTKIYLKYDSETFDSDGNRYGYVFLRNRTFVNAHLIKSGNVEVDESSEYRFKSKFLSYQKESPDKKSGLE